MFLLIPEHEKQTSWSDEGLEFVPKQQKNQLSLVDTVCAAGAVV